jgi:hypothetical protein
MQQQMPPKGQAQPPPSPKEDVAALVSAVGEGLGKLTDLLNGVSPDAAARMADVATAFMETVAALEGGAEEPAAEAPAEERPAPRRGPAPQMGGPKGIPV